VSLISSCFPKNPFHGGPVFIGGFTGGYVKEKFRRSETQVLNESLRFRYFDFSMVDVGFAFVPNVQCFEYGFIFSFHANKL
jgi:hypothetical protein